MNNTQLIQTLVSDQHNSWLTRLARRLLLSRFAHLETGRICLQDGADQYSFGSPCDDLPNTIELQVLDCGFYADVVFGGSIGAGESYMRGAWTVSDLTGLVRALLRNRHVLDSVDSGFGRMLAPLNKAFHWLHRNNLKGSRQNIAAHYDLGNEMFAAFLDQTMTYSSGIFLQPNATMYEASIEKLDRICRKLELTAADHVLEIGSGWGSFAIHAASHYGCHVTTTTISQQQFELATERIVAAGLEDRITLLLQDYRELQGAFDKLVSIEMIEAIGHANYPDYFRRCSELLKPNGQMLLQAITIADQRFKAAARSVDFIQRHIFPGSCIPSITAMSTAIAEHSDLKMFHLEDIGPHYATTLERWRQAFFHNIGRVRELGYSLEFERMWEFYLCYCEGGFIERALGDVQLLLVKPLNRRRPVAY